MTKAIVMGLNLFALWLLLSGYFEPLLLALGVVSSLFVVFIAWRMHLIDEESVPLQLPFVRLVCYLAWLAREVAKANLAVSRIILARNMPVSQHMMRVPTSQKTDMGRVIYANSITLTPGTITIETEPNCFLVHAISDEAADLTALADMDRRVTRVESR